MDRVKDYAAFAARFTGLAYVLVYALTSPELGAPAASLLPGSLPPGLHLMGALAAGLVAAQSLLSALGSGRKSANSEPTTAPAATPGVTLRYRAPPPSRIKPRNHFGLRGLPR